MCSRPLRTLVGALSAVLAVGCAADAPETFLDELSSPPVIDTVVLIRPQGTASMTERLTFTRSSSTVVFLNRQGRRYFAGTDDSATGSSSVLSYYRRSAVSFPAAGYSDGEWAVFIHTIRRYFSPFDVTVTDLRPGSGAYVELAVGDAWASVLGLANNIGGIAPMGLCSVVPEGIGYVFTRIYEQPGYGGLAGAAEAAAHELGHMLSLAHESLATDLMSYAPHSPLKNFQDQPSPCGTSPGAELCVCAGQSQNSHQQLVRMVGARSAETPPLEPVAPGGSPSPSGDRRPPRVTLLGPSDSTRLPAQSTVDVVVEATDDTQVTTVGLYWQFLGRVLACDDSVQGVSCTRSGARFTWRLYVGSGERRFYAIAGDLAQNRAQTPFRTVYFDDPRAPTSPSDAPPSVVPRSPVGGTWLAPGSQLIFQAEVYDDLGLTDVRAVWTFRGGSLEYPMVRTAVPGLWQALTAVSNGALPGPRSVSFVATDSTGQRSSSGRVSLSVR